MPKPLNLTSSMAAAVQSAMKAIEFEGGAIHIAFDPTEVFVTEAGWVTVRGGLHGHEEHKGLAAFESAYELDNTQPELLALAYELEGMCAIFVLHAEEEGNDTAEAIWGERRDRCRAAISASIARAALIRNSSTDKSSTPE